MASCYCGTCVLCIGMLLCDSNRRLAVLVLMLHCAAVIQLLLRIVHMAGHTYVAFLWLLFLASWQVVHLCGWCAMLLMFICWGFLA